MKKIIKAVVVGVVVAVITLAIEYKYFNKNTNSETERASFQSANGNNISQISTVGDNSPITYDHGMK